MQLKLVKKVEMKALILIGDLDLHCSLYIKTLTFGFLPILALGFILWYICLTHYFRLISACLLFPLPQALALSLCSGLFQADMVKKHEANMLNQHATCLHQGFKCMKI